MPAGTRILTYRESGETRAEGVRAAVAVRTLSSAINLADLGETRVEVGSGAVAVDGAAQLRAKTSSGIDKLGGVHRRGCITESTTPGNPARARP